jgi:chemotaxis signal transduction protein
MTTAAIAVVCFELCHQRYAVEVDDVVEVAAMVEAAPLGDDKSAVLHGVVIRHGEPLILLDLRRLMGCDEAVIDLSTLFIVVKPGKELVGFIVDRVQGVIYFLQDDMRPIHDGKGFIRGVVAQDGVLVKWLDVAQILADTLPDDVETE